jgi:hypothetical protein
MNKKETSKDILYKTLIVCAILSTLCFIGWFKEIDGAPEMLQIVAGVALLELGYYSWKARSENIEKIKKRGILSEETMNILASQDGNKNSEYSGYNEVVG